MRKIITKLKDTPLTLVNYKEPLLKIKKGDGIGYYGVLLSTLDGKEIQCHICGQLFRALSMHILWKHRVSVRDYKKKFQLAYKTSLISEVERERRKIRTLEWLKTLTLEQKEEYKQRARERWERLRGQPTLQLETKNKRGTCPDQILKKVKEIAKKLRHTPSKAEFIAEIGGQRYVHLIYKIFGSWTNALKILKLTPVQNPGNTTDHSRHTNEELLEYLLIFTQENQRIPTYTDFNRGLLPSYQIYGRRFKSIEQAREEAGVYKIIDKNTLRGYKKTINEK